MSIDAKITQTTNPIVDVTKTIGLWLMLFKLPTYCPISHPEIYCTENDCYFEAKKYAQFSPPSTS